MRILREVSPVAKLLFLAGVLALGGCRSERPDAAAGLLQAFQSSCGSQGRWSELASSHNAALVSVVDRLSKTSACAPYVDSLGKISTASTQIGRLLKDGPFQDYRRAEETLQELTVTLENLDADDPLTPKIAEELGKKIVQVQVDLAMARVEDGFSRGLRDSDRYAIATEEFAELMKTVMSQTGGLATCLKQSPEVAAQLATNLVTMGGSFVSPVYGAAAAVVGQLINLSVEYARSAKDEEALWRFYSSEMPSALSCSLETMTNFYCAANDSLALVLLQNNRQITDDTYSEPIWRGLDILSRRLPELNTWLLSVKNGILPADPAEAARQNNAWNRLNSLDQFNRDVVGVLAERDRLFRGAEGNLSRQLEILSKLLKDLSGFLAYTEGANPFAEKSGYSECFAWWLVKGPRTECRLPNAQDPAVGAGETYIKNLLLPTASMDGISLNWRMLLADVKVSVDQEFRQTISAEPDILLAQGRQNTRNRISPQDALLMIRAFVQMVKDRDNGANPHLPTLLNNTLKVLDTAIDALGVSAVCPPDAGPADPCRFVDQDKIRKIFDTLQLRLGLQVFNQRIRQIIEWDLDRRLREGEFPRSIADILDSAAEDVGGRLTAAGVDFEAAQLDLNRARSKTEGNIKAFRSAFGTSISKAVGHWHRAAVSTGEPARGVDRPNLQSLAQLCVLLLASDVSGTARLPSECKGVVLESIYQSQPGAPAGLSIEVSKLEKELAGKEFKYRACAFQRYTRAGKIYNSQRDRRIKSQDFDFLGLGSLEPMSIMIDPRKWIEALTLP